MPDHNVVVLPVIRIEREDSMTIHEALCRAIWNNTYKHDTLLEWQEIKPGTLHHQRVVAAAKAAYAATQS